jgi:hypothetical protein
MSADPPTPTVRRRQFTVPPASSMQSRPASSLNTHPPLIGPDSPVIGHVARIARRAGTRRSLGLQESARRDVQSLDTQDRVGGPADLSVSEPDGTADAATAVLHPPAATARATAAARVPTRVWPYHRVLLRPHRIRLSRLLSTPAVAQPGPIPHPRDRPAYRCRRTRVGLRPHRNQPQPRHQLSDTHRPLGIGLPLLIAASLLLLGLLLLGLTAWRSP